MVASMILESFSSLSNSIPISSPFDCTVVNTLEPCKALGCASQQDMSHPPELKELEWFPRIIGGGRRIQSSRRSSGLGFFCKLEL